MKLYKRSEGIDNSSTTTVDVPIEVHDSETIVRSIFSPINIHKKSGELLPNAFKTMAGYDELSVNRLDYTTADFCKYLSKEIAKNNSSRTYCGLAVLKAHEIRETKSEVIGSPLTEPIDNPFHADIVIGFIPVKGEPLPPEFNLKVKTLASNARFYKEKDIDADKWTGDELV